MPKGCEAKRPAIARVAKKRETPRADPAQIEYLKSKLPKDARGVPKLGVSQIAASECAPKLTKGKWKIHKITVDENRWDVINPPRIFNYTEWQSKNDRDEYEDNCYRITEEYYSEPNRKITIEKFAERSELWCFEFDLDMEGDYKTLQIVCEWPLGLLSFKEIDQYKEACPEGYCEMFPEEGITFIEKLFPIAVDTKAKQFIVQHSQGHSQYVDCIRVVKYKGVTLEAPLEDKHSLKKGATKRIWTTWTANCKKSVSTFFNSVKSIDGRIESLQDLYDIYKTQGSHEKIKDFDDFKHCVAACKKKDTANGKSLIPTRKRRLTRKRRQ